MYLLQGEAKRSAKHDGEESQPTGGESGPVRQLRPRCSDEGVPHSSDRLGHHTIGNEAEGNDAGRIDKHEAADTATIQLTGWQPKKIESGQSCSIVKSQKFRSEEILS